jgi:hypothetical protein
MLIAAFGCTLSGCGASSVYADCDVVVRSGNITYTAPSDDYIKISSCEDADACATDRVDELCGMGSDTSGG